MNAAAISFCHPWARICNTSPDSDDTVYCGGASAESADSGGLPSVSAPNQPVTAGRGHPARTRPTSRPPAIASRMPQWRRCWGRWSCCKAPLLADVGPSSIQVAFSGRGNAPGGRSIMLRLPHPFERCPGRSRFGCNRRRFGNQRNDVSQSLRGNPPNRVPTT